MRNAVAAFVVAVFSALVPAAVLIPQVAHADTWCPNGYQKMGNIYTGDQTLGACQSIWLHAGEKSDGFVSGDPIIGYSSSSGWKQSFWGTGQANGGQFAGFQHTVLVQCPFGCDVGAGQNPSYAWNNWLHRIWLEFQHGCQSKCGWVLFHSFPWWFKQNPSLYNCYPPAAGSKAARNQRASCSLQSKGS